MISIVSWRIDKHEQPWREPAEMALRGEADVALLQEAGSPPGDVAHLVRHKDDVYRDRRLLDRWPRVVQLTDQPELSGFARWNRSANSAINFPDEVPHSRISAKLSNDRGPLP